VRPDFQLTLGNERERTDGILAFPANPEWSPGEHTRCRGYDRQRADAVIRSGVADLVSFGKAFLANPDLPQRLKIGAALNVPDPDTFYGGGEKGYVDYSAL
jgi:N-ethylmaleimide reductase